MTNKILMMMILAHSLNSYAQTPSLSEQSLQEGGHSGNGGDPNELAEFIGLNHEHLTSWYSVKEDLIAGFILNKHTRLNLGNNSPEKFKEKALHALKKAKLYFDQKNIELNGIPRTCENFKDEKGGLFIHCNENKYIETMKNYTSELQYKFIAHEYFSLAELESNENETSSYTYSSQISNSLTSVLVKRWGVSPVKTNNPKIDLINNESQFCAKLIEHRIKRSKIYKQILKYSMIPLSVVVSKAVGQSVISQVNPNNSQYRNFGFGAVMAGLAAEGLSIYGIVKYEDSIHKKFIYEMKLAYVLNSALNTDSQWVDNEMNRYHYDDNLNKVTSAVDMVFKDKYNRFPNNQEEYEIMYQKILSYLSLGKDFLCSKDRNYTDFLISI